MASLGTAFLAAPPTQLSASAFTPYRGSHIDNAVTLLSIGATPFVGRRFLNIGGVAQPIS